MLPDLCQIALKEWAITVNALAQGQQILLLRKGGIHEESKDFRVIHPEFLLYPTYEHQREDLLKPDYQPALRQLLQDSLPGNTITFTHWAKVAELIEISDQEKTDALGPHHIWDSAYAQARLHWKAMVPLTIMLLRVYRMEQPVTVTYLPEYGGCKSWVDILATFNLGRLEPALSDAEFQRQVDEIKGSLGLAARV